MCIRLLNTDEAGARAFLELRGWIDLALPVLFLVPFLRIPALGYAAIWGLATALARVCSYFTAAENFIGVVYDAISPREGGVASLVCNAAPHGVRAVTDSCS
jgi:hypothetical protein